MKTYCLACLREKPGSHADLCRRCFEYSAGLLRSPDPAARAYGRMIYALPYTYQFRREGAL